ncbi:hypothetical protein GCM10011360_26910 [Primorskyibacter flagellatus]|uniref:Uncharacterized protein n=1 Tax=Primorskyibacter flagellatus TaxID=1387277 RepID=A0A917AC33_9RHOB|nr:hypothetical protein GCM10011360_26910 [Primorskyibacter flagellatus]
MLCGGDFSGGCLPGLTVEAEIPGSGKGMTHRGMVHIGATGFPHPRGGEGRVRGTKTCEGGRTREEDEDT